jgi:hypothetical protein
MQEIGETSTKLITFIDLAGHHKYLKTTISALTGEVVRCVRYCTGNVQKIWYRQYGRFLLSVTDVANPAVER